MKLELKHLAPYLPYGLKCTNSKESYLQTGEDKTGVLETLSLKDDETVIMGKNGYFLVSYNEVVPILRPLSDLLKPIETEEFGKLSTGVEFICTSNKMKAEFLLDIKTDCLSIDLLEYWQIKRLFKYHFDVFGLIEKGLAVSHNNVGIEKIEINTTDEADLNFDKRFKP